MNGNIHFVRQGGRALELKALLEQGESFTDALDETHWKDLKAIDVYLLSFDGKTIAAAALGRRKKYSATRLRQIEFEPPFVHPMAPIETSAVNDLLPQRLKSYWPGEPPGSSIPPKTWSTALEVLGNLDAEFASAVRQMNAMASGNAGVRESDSRLRFEMDGVGTVADIALGSRARRDILRAGTIGLTPEHKSGRRSFVDAVKACKYKVEGASISKDARFFPGFEQVDYAADFGGFATFENKLGERLHVLVLDRTRGEKKTGADLLYYSEVYQSVILVQYKEMRKESDGGKPCYRPDEQFRSQLVSLQTVSGDLGARPPSLPMDPSALRLHSCPVFVKLCHPPEGNNLARGDLARGMYISVEHWPIVEAAAKGKRGATRLAPDTVGRSLATTSFCEFVKAGWLGSRPIDGLSVIRYVEDALSNNRSVVVASHPDSTKPRDTRGRSQPLVDAVDTSQLSLLDDALGDQDE